MPLCGLGLPLIAAFLRCLPLTPLAASSFSWSPPLVTWTLFVCSLLRMRLPCLALLSCWLLVSGAVLSWPLSVPLSFFALRCLAVGGRCFGRGGGAGCVFGGGVLGVWCLVGSWLLLLWCLGVFGGVVVAWGWSVGRCGVVGWVACVGLGRVGWAVVVVWWVVCWRWLASVLLYLAVWLDTCPLCWSCGATRGDEVCGPRARRGDIRRCHCCMCTLIPWPARVLPPLLAACAQLCVTWSYWSPSFRLLHHRCGRLHLQDARLHTRGARGQIHLGHHVSSGGKRAH